MKLYHYSKEKFDELKSKNGQFGVPSTNKLSYSDQISFLLEPVPLNLPSLLENTYAQWQPWKLFEYVIDTSTFNKDVPFAMWETPKAVDLLYNKQDWSLVKNDNMLRLKYIEQMKQLMVKEGYQGIGVTDLNKVIGKFNKGIKDYYLKALALSKQYPEDQIQDKYAACVPHVLVYVGNNPVHYVSCKEITLK